jgi:type VI secretion system protein VasJ
MSYSSQLYTYYLELATSTIFTQQFAVEDVRFFSEFEALEHELAKTQSMHESGKTDWLKVQEVGEAFVRSQSKDLRMSAWLTWALYQRDSFSGLLVSYALLQHLSDSPLARIHPSKLRTHTAAIGWLVPCLEHVLSENVVIKEQLPLFRRVVEHQEGLDAVCTKHLGDDARLLLPITLRFAVQRAAADNQPSLGLAGAAALVQVKQVATPLFAADTPIDSVKENPQGAARPARARTAVVCLVAQSESHRTARLAP